MFSLSSPRSRRGGGRPPRPLPLLPTLLGCLLLLAVFPAASTPVSLTFPQALRLAEQNAPLLEARQARLEAAREDAGRAAALPDPRLTLGLSNWPINGPDAFDLRADEMTTQEIGLMQEFPARAKRRARQALADAGLEQARAMSLVERNAVRQAAATAWIELWSAQRTRDALIGLREPTDAAVRTAARAWPVAREPRPMHWRRSPRRCCWKTASMPPRPPCRRRRPACRAGCRRRTRFPSHRARRRN